MGHAVLAAPVDVGRALKSDDEPETIEVEGLSFTQEQFESASLIDDQRERIAEKLAEGVYFERYGPENRVRDLSENAEIAEVLFNNRSDSAQAEAMQKLAEGGNCTQWLFWEDIRPMARKFVEELFSEAADLAWESAEDEEEFIDAIAQDMHEIVLERDESEPAELLSSCDRVEVAFIFMPPDGYLDDYLIVSHKTWSEWSELAIDQGLLETLPRLGYNLTEYRKHSKNKHERSDATSRHPRRLPVASLDEVAEIVTEACASSFHIAIYAQVPLKDLLKLDFSQPIVLDRYSLCTFSSSGTFYSVEKEEPIVLRPEDGRWHAFGKSGPSDWCGLVGSYFYASIKN